MDTIVAMVTSFAMVSVSPVNSVHIIFEKRKVSVNETVWDTLAQLLV